MILRIYEFRGDGEVWSEGDTVIYFNKEINCLKCWAVNTDHNYTRYVQGPTQDGGGGKLPGWSPLEIWKKANIFRDCDITRF